MDQYARTDDDLKKQKVSHNSWRQANKAPRPPQTPCNEIFGLFTPLTTSKRRQGNQHQIKHFLGHRQTNSIEVLINLHVVAREARCAWRTRWQRKGQRLGLLICAIVQD
jgi:hypothetical protein